MLALLGVSKGVDPFPSLGPSGPPEVHSPTLEAELGLELVEISPKRRKHAAAVALETMEGPRSARGAWGKQGSSMESINEEEEDNEGQGDEEVGALAKRMARALN